MKYLGLTWSICDPCIHLRESIKKGEGQNVE